MSINPFAYNETVAQEYFSLTKEEAITQGYTWKDEEEKHFSDPTYTALDINQYDETVVNKELAQKNTSDLLNGIIKCEISGKPFRITKQELAFYIKHHLPILTIHPDMRHLERMTMRPKRELHLRTCDKCGVEMVSVYPDDRKDVAMQHLSNTSSPSPRIYCESCYNKEIY